MTSGAWIKEFPGVAIVCDLTGTIVEMNDRAVRQYERSGGAALVGRSLFDCHPPAAAEKLKALLASGATNVYTIEKRGLKKVIYQAPWFRDGARMGLVELSLELPADMPHFVRPG